MSSGNCIGLLETANGPLNAKMISEPAARDAELRRASQSTRVAPAPAENRYNTRLFKVSN